MKKLTAVAALAAAAIAALVTVQLAGADAHQGRPGSDVQHIFVIVLENHSQQSVIGDPNAPYITSLAQKYASAGNYYGVTHPSEPNYVAMISGSNWWINTDDPNTRLDHTNLVDELAAGHKTWAAYMEAMPSDNKTADYWPSTTDKLYASKHNPFVLFNDIRNDPARMAHVKTYDALSTDLASVATTPDFAFIVPDQCNDMHGGIYNAVPGHPEAPCPYNDTNDDPNDIALKQKADAFVKTTVQTIMGSPSWNQGQDAIFIVSDEGDFTGTPASQQNGGWDSPAGCCDSPVVAAGDTDIDATWPGGVYGGGLVPAVVIVNRHGKTGGYVSQTPYNHYSLLATIEQVWRLPKLAYASDTAQVTPMTEFFTP
jgi:phosphatidylinositol-3-phosphatase